MEICPEHLSIFSANDLYNLVQFTKEILRDVYVYLSFTNKFLSDIRNRTHGTCSNVYYYTTSSFLNQTKCDT